MSVISIPRFKSFAQSNSVLLFVFDIILNKTECIKCPIRHSSKTKDYVVLVLRKLRLDIIVEDFEQGRGAT